MAQSPSRIANVEQMLDEMRKDIREIRKDVGGLREAVFNGLQEGVADMRQKLDTHLTKTTRKGKNPRRWELLAGIATLLTVLSFLGLLQPIGEAFRQWITGGGG